MSKIYFGSNIKSNNNSLANVFKGNFKSNLTDVYGLAVGLVNVSNLFNGCSNLKYVNYELEDTLIDISSLFTNCIEFSQDINIPRSVQNASYAFSGSNIKNAIFNDYGTINGTLDLSYCFYNCKNLDSVGGVISNFLYNASGCFKNSSVINTPILENGAIGINDITGLFSDCNNIQYVNMILPDDGAINSGDNIFSNCSNLKEYPYDLNFKKSLNNTFYNCSNLIKTGNIKTMNTHQTFYNCSNLIKTGNIKTMNMHQTFYNCSNLMGINIELNIDGTQKSYINNIFEGCSNLMDINITPHEFRSDCDFTDWGALNPNSVINIIGMNHTFEQECHLRSILSNNLKPYYQSEYFNTNNFEKTIYNKFLKFNPSSVISNYIYLDNRIRSDIHNCETESNVFFNDYCFDGSNLNNVMMRGIMNTGNYCFNNSSIVDFYAEDSSLNQSVGVFSNCYNLNSVWVEHKGNPIDIPKNYFKNCIKLTNIFTSGIPFWYGSSIGNVGDYGLYQCCNLHGEIQSGYLNLSKTYSIGEYGLYNTSFNNMDLSLYSHIGNDSLWSVHQKNNVVMRSWNKYYINSNLGDNSLYDVRINNLTLTESRNIGRYDFYRASGITSLYAPNVTTLYNYCFANSSIKYFDFGGQSISIYNNCFDNMNFYLTENLAKSKISPHYGSGYSLIKNTTVTLKPIEYQSRGYNFFNGNLDFINMLYLNTHFSIPDNTIIKGNLWVNKSSIHSNYYLWNSMNTYGFEDSDKSCIHSIMIQDAYLAPNYGENLTYNVYYFGKNITFNIDFLYYGQDDTSTRPNTNDYLNVFVNNANFLNYAFSKGQSVEDTDNDLYYGHVYITNDTYTSPQGIGLNNEDFLETEWNVGYSYDQSGTKINLSSKHFLNNYVTTGINMINSMPSCMRNAIIDYKNGKLKV